MANDLLITSGRFPDGTIIATEELTGGEQAGLLIVVDPADRTKALKPAADGSLPLSAGAATETTLAALLAKILAAPATEAKQDASNTLLTAIAGYVDGLEGKDYATQTTLAALLAKVIAAPSTEAKQDSMIALLTLLNTYVDGLEGKDYATQTTLAAVLAKMIAAPATEAKQDAIIAKLIAAPATEAKQDAIIAKQPSLGTAGSPSANVISVQGEVNMTPIRTIGGIAILQNTLTRPADTTPYAVGDAIGSSTTAPVLQFLANASRIASGSGTISRMVLQTNQVACVARIRARFYMASTVQNDNDNAAFLIKDTDKASYLGYVDFPAFATEAGSDTAEAIAPSLQLDFVADANSKLFYRLETLTAFTPASGQTFSLLATANQN